jgi:hypothetical protein
MLNTDTKLAILVVFMGLKLGLAEEVLQLIQTHAVRPYLMPLCTNVTTSTST